jgi:hypothetical protein
LQDQKSCLAVRALMHSTNVDGTSWIWWYCISYEDFTLNHASTVCSERSTPNCLLPKHHFSYFLLMHHLKCLLLNHHFFFQCTSRIVRELYGQRMYFKLVPPRVSATPCVSNYFFFPLSLRPYAGYDLLIVEVYRSHTQWRTTIGRTPLDELSARRSDLYLTTNTHNRQTSMHPAGFEPTISAGKRPQTHALDRAASGAGCQIAYCTVVTFLKSLITLRLKTQLY